MEAEDAVGVEAVVEDGGGDVSYNEEMNATTLNELTSKSDRAAMFATDHADELTVSDFLMML